jgi:hypothetical protein
MAGLSISSLNNNYYSPIYAQSTSSAAQTDLNNLGQALQSGNLSAAQSAFTAFQKTYQSQNPATQSASTLNPVTTDLTNLATALNSGNLTTAQSVYKQLQQDMQAQIGHHHHHHGGAGGAVQALLSQLSSTASNGGPTSGTTGTLDLQA